MKPRKSWANWTKSNGNDRAKGGNEVNGASEGNDKTWNIVKLPKVGRRATRRQRMSGEDDLPMIFILEEQVDFPVFILSLTLTQILLHVLSAYDLFSYDDLMFKHTRRYEIWRYFTVMARLVPMTYKSTHLVCLLFNQLSFGIYMENLQGSKFIALLYLSGTLFGELLATSVEPIPERECSAAGQLTLMSAYICYLILNPGVIDSIHFLFLAYSLSCCLAESVLVEWCRITTGTHSCDMLYSIGFVNISTYAVNTGGIVAGILVGISAMEFETCRPWRMELQRRVMYFTGATFLSFILYNAILVPNEIRWR